MVLLQSLNMYLVGISLEETEYKSATALILIWNLIMYKIYYSNSTPDETRRDETACIQIPGLLLGLYFDEKS